MLMNRCQCFFNMFSVKCDLHTKNILSKASVMPRHLSLHMNGATGYIKDMQNYIFSS